jgi:hypothetical protein
LAGATLGLELVRRTAGENNGSPLGVFLAEVLIPEIIDDRETSAPKIAAAWTLAAAADALR